MQAKRACHRAHIAILLSGVLACPPALVAQTKATSGTTPKPASTTTAVPDLGWPRRYDLSEGATAVLYQPQIADWDDQKRMAA